MNALFLSSSPLAVLWGQLGGEGWLSSVPCFWIACHLRRALLMWFYFFRSLLLILLSSFAFIAVILSLGKGSFECTARAVSSKKYTCKPPIICEVFAPCLPSEMDPKCWWGSRVRSPMQTEPWHQACLALGLPRQAPQKWRSLWQSPATLPAPTDVSAQAHQALNLLPHPSGAPHVCLPALGLPSQAVVPRTCAETTLLTPR